MSDDRHNRRSEASLPWPPVAERSCVSNASIERFADYSDDELARLLAELERGGDVRLARLLVELRSELERRATLRER